MNMSLTNSPLYSLSLNGVAPDSLQTLIYSDMESLRYVKTVIKGLPLELAFLLYEETINSTFEFIKWFSLTGSCDFLDTILESMLRHNGEVTLFFYETSFLINLDGCPLYDYCELRPLMKWMNMKNVIPTLLFHKSPFDLSVYMYLRKNQGSYNSIILDFIHSDTIADFLTFPVNDKVTQFWFSSATLAGFLPNPGKNLSQMFPNISAITYVVGKQDLNLHRLEGLSKELPLKYLRIHFTKEYINHYVFHAIGGSIFDPASRDDCAKLISSLQEMESGGIQIQVNYPVGLNTLYDFQRLEIFRDSLIRLQKYVSLMSSGYLSWRLDTLDKFTNLIEVELNYPFMSFLKGLQVIKSNSIRCLDIRGDYPRFRPCLTFDFSGAPNLSKLRTFNISITDWSIATLPSSVKSIGLIDSDIIGGEILDHEQACYPTHGDLRKSVSVLGSTQDGVKRCEKLKEIFLNTVFTPYIFLVSVD